MYASHFSGVRSISNVLNVKLILLLTSGVLELKIDGKTSARSGFCHVRERGFVTGLKHKAHWMAADSWMKVVHVWHMSWATVRRVRLSSWRRISSKISGIEKTWDWADSVMDSSWIGGWL